MYDANSILQSTVTKTATFSGAGLNIPGGTPRRGLKARFVLSSYASVGTAGTVFTPSIEHSDDNITFTPLASGVPVIGATTANSAVIHVPFETDKPYVRAVMTLSPSSGTPSVTYKAEIGLARP